VNLSDAGTIEIAVFAKAPVPDEAKTRLIPRLGAEGAARLQERLIERALQKSVALPGARVTLWVAGDVQHPFIAACAQRAGIRVRIQQGSDLGARMLQAFATTLAPGRGDRCLLIGTDCPALATTDLALAAQALATHDAVVQPAEDGGYVLIGLRAPHAQLFEGIESGGPTMMHATRERLARVGLRWCERPPLPDLDTPEETTDARSPRAGSRPSPARAGAACARGCRDDRTGALFQSPDRRAARAVEARDLAEDRAPHAVRRRDARRRAGAARTRRCLVREPR
jgi:rSAM/selenodomain-associated transferase 1